MTDGDGRLLDQLGKRLSATADQLSQLVALRWRLAEIELQESAQAGKRLAIFAAVAVVALLTSLPVLVVAACAWLEKVAPLGPTSWMWPVGLLMAAGGSALGWFAWRRFRSEFRGLEQSIEELREDVVWLREWVNRPDQEEVDLPG